MSIEDYRDKVKGSLLGGAIGDALGAPVESWSHEQIVNSVGLNGVRTYLKTAFGNIRGIGPITDDTQMTLFTMEGIIAAYECGRGRSTSFVMQLELHGREFEFRPGTTSP